MKRLKWCEEGGVSNMVPFLSLLWSPVSQMSNWKVHCLYPFLQACTLIYQAGYYHCLLTSFCPCPPQPLECDLTIHLCLQSKSLYIKQHACLHMLASTSKARYNALCHSSLLLYCLIIKKTTLFFRAAITTN